MKETSLPFQGEQAIVERGLKWLHARRGVATVRVSARTVIRGRGGGFELSLPRIFSMVVITEHFFQNSYFTTLIFMIRVTVRIMFNWAKVMEGEKIMLDTR